MLTQESRVAVVRFPVLRGGLWLLVNKSVSEGYSLCSHHLLRFKKCILMRQDLHSLSFIIKKSSKEGDVEQALSVKSVKA